MKQHTFEQQHQALWDHIKHTIDKRGQQSSDFPAEYRQVCQHLALARDRHYSPNLIARLNHLVLQGHQYFYRRRLDILPRFSRFIYQDFPQSVRQEWRFVFFASLFFFLSFFVMALLIYTDNQLIYSIFQERQLHNFREMYDPTAERWGMQREAESNIMMFGHYIINNVSIDFKIFASGIFFGIGSVFFLVFNGIFLGAISGYLIAIGYNVSFLSFVSGHSSFELLGMVIAGAAGLKLGTALMAPQRYRRTHALRVAAKEALPLIYGAFLMTVIAAFIEAFWSSDASIAAEIKYQVGAGLWGLLLLYFLGIGRTRAA